MKKVFLTLSAIILIAVLCKAVLLMTGDSEEIQTLPVKNNSSWFDASAYPVAIA